MHEQESDDVGFVSAKQEASDGFPNGEILRTASHIKLTRAKCQKAHARLVPLLLFFFFQNIKPYVFT